MTLHTGRYVTTFTLILAALGLVSSMSPRESQAGSCPYGGDYMACVLAETVDYCKQYVLNCQDHSGPMEEDEAPCDWIVDQPLGTDCPWAGGYVHVGFPQDVITHSNDCPYDSYLDCVIATHNVPMCKQHQLNCSASTTATVVVPIEAACGPFSIDGTIEYEGTPEIIGSNYCLHVTGYTYTGGHNAIVDAQIDDDLATHNPDCNGDTNCVCMPASCL